MDGEARRQIERPIHKWNYYLASLFPPGFTNFLAQLIHDRTVTTHFPEPHIRISHERQKSASAYWIQYCLLAHYEQRFAGFAGSSFNEQETHNNYNIMRLFSY